jgi:hypothetical protein
VEKIENHDVGNEKQCCPGDEDMPGHAGGEAAERFDDKNKQDGLGPAEITLHYRGVLVDEEEGIAQGFEDIVGHEKQEAVEGQQKSLESFPLTDISEEAEEPVEQAVICLRLVLAHLGKEYQGTREIAK